MAPKAPKKPLIERLESLPNELQDMIFGNDLGWELQSFVYRRGTSASALKALWTHYCARGSLSPSGRNTRISYARRQMNRPNRILSIVAVDPYIAFSIRELSIAVPVDGRDQSKLASRSLSHQLPAAWQKDTLVALLGSLVNLDTLHIVSVPISMVSAQRLPFKDVGKYLQAFQIPSSVKYLSIVESIPAVKGYRYSFPVRLVSDQFRGFEKVESLKLKIPLAHKAFFRCIKKFAAIRFLRLDIDNTSRFASSPALVATLLNMINVLPELITLELHYKDNGTYDLFPAHWRSHVPRLTTIRLPLHAFHAAFANSWPADDIRFEVMLNKQKLSASSEHMRRYEAKMDRMGVKHGPKFWITLRKAINAIDRI